MLSTNANGRAGPTVTLGDTDTGANAVAFLTTGSGASRNITVSANGTGTATIGSTTGAGSGNVVFSGTTTLNRATTLTGASTDRTTWTGQITGNVGTLTIAGGNRIVFEGTSNTFTGNIAITGSNTVLQTGVGTGSEHIPNGSSVDVGSGTFLKLAGVAGAVETIDALTGSGTVRRHEGVAGLQTLVIGSANGGGTFSGPLENGGGTLALTKNGSGTQILTGANTYTGTTTVSGGTLEVGGGGVLGASGSYGGAISLAGALKINSTAAQTLSGLISGAGTLTKSNTGTLILSGANTGFSGGTTLTAGVLSADHDSALGTGALTLSGGTLRSTSGNRILANSLVATAATTTALLDNTGTGDMVLSGTVTGSGAITVNSTLSRSIWLQGNGAGFNGTINYTNNNGGTNFRLGGTGVGGNSLTNGSDWSGTTFALSGSGTNDRGLLWNGLAGTTVKLGALSGTGRIGVTGNAAVWEIGALNTTTTFSGVIDGTNTAVTKAGTGTLTLSGANSYTGTTTVNTGTLKIGYVSALGAIQGSKPVTQVVVNSGGAIDFNGVVDATYGYTISGTGVGGTGALVNTGSGIGNGTAQTSNIKLSADATVGGTGNWALLTNSYGATSLNLNGFTMTKAGSNTLSLANATTTAGTVVLSAGTLQLGVTENASTAVNGAASAFAVNGGTLSMIRSSSLGSLTGTGGSLSVAASTTLTVGALNTSPAAFAGSVTLGSGSTLSKTGTGTLHLTGAGSGPATVSVGAGTFKVAGARGFNEGFFTNNDSVNYTVAAGATLEVAANYNTRSNNGVTLNGGTLHFSTAGSDNYLNSITFNTGTSTITSVGGFRGGYFYSPTTTVNAAASGSTISSALVFVNNGTPTWTFNVDNGAQAADLTVSGVMQDLAGWSGMRMVKSGTGTMALTAANTYTAETTVSAGTLALTGSGALSDSSTVNTSAAGAVFDLSGISASSETIGALAGAASSSVVLGGKTLVAGASNASTSFAGAISGTGALTKTGTGTLTLSGANAHTGGTTISAGTIAATNSSAFSSGTVTLNGGTLNTSVNLSNLIVLNNTTNFIAPNGAYRQLGGQITGAGGFKLINGGGTPGLEFNNPANNFAGNIELDPGTYLRLTAAEVIPDTAVVTINGGGHLRLDIPGGGTETVAGLSLSGSIWVPTDNNAMHTLAVGAGNTSSSFSGAVGPSGQNNAYLNLVKTGSGTFTMSGASYYEGGTTVNAGTLLLNRNVGWDAGNAQTIGTGNITVNSGAVVRNGTDHSIWGGHQNTRTVTVNGGTVDLAGGQEYFHKLQMTGGTLQNIWIRVGSAVGAGGITTLASATTALINTGVDMTFGSLTLNVADGAAASDLTMAYAISENSGAGSGAKNLTKNGAGTLTLSGNNTYTGATSVNDGVLLVNGVHTGGGLISVSATATLGGGGQVGSVEFWSAGTLAPGRADATDNWLQVGDLTLGDAATQVNFELGHPDDGLASLPENDLVLAANIPYLRGVLNVTPKDGFAAAPAGSKWRLFDSTAGGTPGAHELTLGAGVATGYAIQAYEGDNAVYLVAVPEAGTSGLVVLGLLLLRRIRGVSRGGHPSPFADNPHAGKP
ncbi:MAG: autotransporter-associated beta strand repeat-containing protein [Kiritimatiellia bacterium]